MKPLVVIIGVLLGLGLPALLFGLTILGLSLADVAAQTLGVGTE